MKHTGKTILTLLLAILMTVGLAGCGSMRYCCGACDLQMERHCLRSFYVAGHCRGGRVRGGWRGIFFNRRKE